MDSTESIPVPSKTFDITFATGVSDEDRLREEQVTVTGWSDRSIGMSVGYNAEDTHTGTYMVPERARAIAHAILRALGDEIPEARSSFPVRAPFAGRTDVRGDEARHESGYDS